jgi:hypothetical protein
MILHTFEDGSVLRKCGVRELIGIPVWRGNRYIDMEHVKQIKQDIGDNISCLDTTIFRVIRYKEHNVEQRWLVDGQHRQMVIKMYFEEATFDAFIEGFDILIIEKEVEGESDAIEYFNTLNNVKPQQENDPRLLTNKFISALEKQFNVNKKAPLIKPEGKTTKRPYLSSDALRGELERWSGFLKQSNAYIGRFIKSVNEWNSRKISEYELGLSYCSPKDYNVVGACIEKKFMLAYDLKLPWVRECLMDVYLKSGNDARS